MNELAISAERKRAEREGSVSRTSISIPSRYLEELDGGSSPGVVSKKAAFFEEAIRTSSNEKQSVPSNVKVSLPRSLNKVDETELAYWKDTAKTLNFSSDSEGSSEIENRPPESNTPGLLAEQVDGMESTDNGQTTTPQDEIMSKEYNPVADETSSSHESSVADALSIHKVDEKDEAGGDACTSGNSSSSDENNVAEMRNDETSSSRCEESKAGVSEESEVDGTGSVQPHADVAAKATDEVDVSDSARAGKVRSKDPDRKVTATAARVQSKSIARENMPVKRNVSVRTSTSMAFMRHQTREAIRSSPVSKSTSFVSQSPATDKKTRAFRTEELKPQTKLVPERNGNGTLDASSLNSVRSSVSSMETPRLSLREFHLESKARAEKRKEFYVKLEERLTAKEHEKNQLKLKAQEDKEAELRKLRQELIFKARPMPSFYHGSPRPMSELRKVPPTRALSPKLGRRKSTEHNNNRHHHVHVCQQVTNEPAIPQAKRNSATASTDSVLRRRTSGGSTIRPNRASVSHPPLPQSTSKPPAVVVQEPKTVRSEEEDLPILNLDLKEEDEALLLT